MCASYEQPDTLPESSMEMAQSLSWWCYGITMWERKISGLCTWLVADNQIPRFTIYTAKNCHLTESIWISNTLIDVEPIRKTKQKRLTKLAISDGLTSYLDHVEILD